MRRAIPVLLALAVVAGLVWAVARRMAELEEVGAGGAAPRPPAPVLVGPVERGPITLTRTYSGTLEASGELVVATKAAGRLKHLTVDLGDPVRRGDVVALLDDDELVQAVHQAEAELAVALATHAEAKSALEIAGRELQRAERLSLEGVTSDSQLDAARAEELASRAHVEVTRAGVAREEAVLEAARIRLGYARVTADWTEGDEHRVVAARLVDEGGNVSANTPLLAIVDLAPIVGVVHVPERDYAGLALGQRASLTTDSHPGRTFEGRVARIAPVFRDTTRQARVELSIPNEDRLLKPGMFVRATVELERIEDATIVPFDALTERGGATGVFVLDDRGETVAWRTVEVGAREGARVQVFAEGLSGRVVTLGQELCEDGARVHVAQATPVAPGQPPSPSAR